MYDKDSSQPAGSWGRFAGRMYFLGDPNNPSSTQLVNHRRDTLWCYIITSVIYFFLISVILIILLLAPKYRLSPQPAHVTSNASDVVGDDDDANKIHSETHQSGIGIGTAVEYQSGGGTGKDDVDLEDDTNTGSKEEEFQGSPKDPLYDDIDPRRSTIFRDKGKSKTHTWMQDDDEEEINYP